MLCNLYKNVGRWSDSGPRSLASYSGFSGLIGINWSLKVRRVPTWYHVQCTARTKEVVLA